MTTTELKQYIEKVLGNNIRCLLPSYWWKRLFNQVADRIDNVEQYAEELVDASKMPIVESEEELNKLDLENGNLAAVLWQETKERSFRELYQASIYEALAGNFSRCTVVEDIITRAPSLDRKVTLVFGTADGSRSFSLVVEGTYMAVITHENKQLYLYRNGEYVQEGHDYLREELSSFQYIFAIAMDLTSGGIDSFEDLKVNYDLIDPFLTCVATLPTADVYVKGNTWEKLAKKGDVGEYTGSSGLPIYIALGNALLTAEQMASNRNTLANIGTEILYAEFVFGVQDGQTLSFKYPISQWSGDFIYVTDWDDGNPNSLLKYTIYSDGSVTYNERIDSVIRKDVWIPAQGYTSNTISKNIGVSFSFDEMPIINEYNGRSWSPTSIVPIYALGTTIRFIREDELIQFKWESATGAYELTSLGRITSDTEMSDTSTNPVQNKVIKAYVDTEVAKKVDKVSGKGLSTEDFTTLLKTKLEGLENYDDTTLSNAISSLETRFNTLVSGDTSAAIESFNEVVAFLENITDTQDLSSIIASIEQQINATKVALQNVVEEVIENEEVTSKGLNSLNQKIAQAINDRKINYATKAELNSEVEVINKEAIDNEEVTSIALNYLNQRIDKLKNDLLINYAKGATLRAEIEAIMAIISDNEKVISTSLNDLNERIEFTNNKFVNYALKEELSSEVSRIEQIILTNEKVISASLNDLNERVEQVSNLIKSSLATN